MPAQTLAQRIRAKYPGSYDDLSDEQLEQAAHAKRPDLVRELTDEASPPPAPAPKRWSDEMTGREFLDYQADQRERIATATNDWMADHPLVSGAVGAGLLLLGARGGRPGGPSGPGGGPSVMTRAVAGAKSVATQTAPIVKYEAAKMLLTKMGVPESLAIPAAMAVSGYKVAGRKAPAPATAPASAPSAPPVSPAASAPAVHTPPAAPGAPPADPRSLSAPQSSWLKPGETLSPQRIRNEVGLAMRRAKLKLSKQQLAQADDLVAKGATPTEAVQQVATAPPAPAATAPGSPPKFRLAAAESKEYQRLRQAGKTHPQAVEAIEQQRAFARQFGTTDPDTARRSVTERNRTGRWPTKDDGSRGPR